MTIRRSRPSSGRQQGAMKWPARRAFRATRRAARAGAARASDVTRFARRRLENRIKDALRMERAGKRQRPVGASDLLARTPSTPEVVVQRRQHLRQALVAISRLRDDQGIELWLYQVEHWPLARIAADRKCDERTVA